MSPSPSYTKEATASSASTAPSTHTVTMSPSKAVTLFIVQLPAVTVPVPGKVTPFTAARIVPLFTAVVRSYS